MAPLHQPLSHQTLNYTHPSIHAEEDFLQGQWPIAPLTFCLSLSLSLTHTHTHTHTDFLCIIDGCQSVCLTTLVSAGGPTVIKTRTCPCSSPFISMSTPAVTHFGSFYIDKGMSEEKTCTFFHLLGNLIPQAERSFAQTQKHMPGRAEDHRCTDIIPKGHVLSCLSNNTPPCAYKPFHFILYSSSLLLFLFFHLLGMVSLHVSSQGASSDLPPSQRQLHDPARCCLEE